MTLATTPGLDSEFGTLEGAVTPIIGDLKMFPNMRKEVFSGKRSNQEINV